MRPEVDLGFAEMVDACESELGLDWGSIQYLRHESIYAQVSVYVELKRLGIAQDARILEVGTGYGLLAYALATKGFDVTAVDFYNEYITADGPLALVAERQSGGTVRIRFVQQDLEAPHWNVPPRSFDVVIGVDVIEHIRNARFFMENCNAALLPGGGLILHTPNYSSFAARLQGMKATLRPTWPTSFQDFIGRNPDYGHVREFNHRELPLLFSSFGFDVVRQTFPRHYDIARLADQDGRVRLKRRLHFAVAEFLRKVAPPLSGAQLVVGVKQRA